MTAAAQHQCWVCAGKDSFVGEPSGLRKAVNVLEDVRLERALSKVVHWVARMGTAAAVLAVGLAVALLGQPVQASGSSLLTGSGSGSMGRGGALALSLGSLAALSCVMVGKAVLLGAQRTERLPELEPEQYSREKKDALAQLLSRALQIPTVSQDESSETETDHGKLLELHALIKEAFPRVHASAHIARTVVNEYSLVYEWAGVNKDSAPVMLCAHMDVVPAPNVAQWDHPPFSGHIDAEGVVWGRGAIDNKHNLLMQLQAVEDLLAAGVEQPPRTVFLAFGHDEEIGGKKGAQFIAKHMSRRLNGAKLDFILDEGPFLIKGVVPGVKGYVALVGNSEKGNVSVRMSVDHFPPGHSSMPPFETNVGVLSRAMQRIESRPLHAHMGEYLDNLTLLGSELPFWFRFVLANRWVFKPLLSHIVLSKPATAAVSRTTSAVTVVRGGDKTNVVPGLAEALVNHRIHPNDVDGETVLALDRRTVSDRRVRLEISKTDPYVPPSGVSPLTGPAFDVLRTTLHRCFGAPLLPCIMVGNTDTRWYWDLSPNIYRHTPVEFESLEDTKMFHGLNERISRDQLASLLHFYRMLIEAL